MGRIASDYRVESSFEIPAETIYNLELGMALSPDGTRLVYLAHDTDGKVRKDREGEAKLRMRRVDIGETFSLEGTNGALGPFWSPDSQYVATVRHYRWGNVLAQPKVLAQRFIDVDTWLGSRPRAMVGNRS